MSRDRAKVAPFKAREGPPDGRSRPDPPRVRLGRLDSLRACRRAAGRLLRAAAAGELAVVDASRLGNLVAIVGRLLVDERQLEMASLPVDEAERLASRLADAVLEVVPDDETRAALLVAFRRALRQSAEASAGERQEGSDLDDLPSEYSLPEGAR